MNDDGLIFSEEKPEYKRVILENRLIDFSLGIDKLCEQLPNKRLGNYIADHMVRSSASVAFNYGEAQSAESRRDFVHKMKICLKEQRECFVGLKFIKRGQYKVGKELFETQYRENDELISIFVKSIQTASRNQ